MSQDISVNLNNREANFSGQVTKSAEKDILRDDKLITQEVEKSVNLNEELSVLTGDKGVASKTPEEVNEDDIKEALEVVASFMDNAFKNVAFSNDSSSGKTVIKVTDKETQELISQFPSEKILSMAEKIKSLHQEIETVSGLLVDSHV